MARLRELIGAGVVAFQDGKHRRATDGRGSSTTASSRPLLRQRHIQEPLRPNSQVVCLHAVGNVRLRGASHGGAARPSTRTCPLPSVRGRRHAHLRRVVRPADRRVPRRRRSDEVAEGAAEKLPPEISACRSSGAATRGLAAETVGGGPSEGMRHRGEDPATSRRTAARRRWRRCASSSRTRRAAADARAPTREHPSAPVPALLRGPMTTPRNDSRAASESPAKSPTPNRAAAAAASRPCTPEGVADAAAHAHVRRQLRGTSFRTVRLRVVA